MSINLGQLLNRDNLNAAFMSKVDDNNILGSVTLTGVNAKLGIGTPTPSEALHVIGDAIIAGSGSTIGGATMANASLLIGSTTAGLGLDSNEMFVIGSDFYIGTIGAAATRFRNGSTDIMMLSNNGNVSIGTTSITDTRLTIEGTHASNVKVMTFGAGTSRSLKLTKTDGISVDGPLYLQPNTTDNVFLASGGGKVAIGSATAPTKALDVTGDIRLTGDFYSNAATVEFYTDAVAALPIKVGGLTVSDNYSDAASANGLFVKGNVGIGGTASTKLHVQGGGIRVTDTAGSALSFDLVGYTSTHCLWMVARNATEPTNAYVAIGTALDWDRQIGINYTPGTTGAGTGLLQIGQTQKNNANFTHGETAFYTNGTEKVRIDKDGDVGIGVSTITAGYKFEVNGSAKLGGALNLAGAISFDDVSRYWLVTATNWGLYWDTSTNELQYHGAGTKRFSVDLDNGLTYIDGNLTFNGNTATSINPNRHTTANTAGTDLTLQAGGATSGATDKAGGNLVLSSGISTGTGGSSIIFQTALPGVTGTTDRTPATRWTIKNDGVFECADAAYIRSATGLVQISSSAGGTIYLSPGTGIVSVSSTTTTNNALLVGANSITSGNAMRVSSTSTAGTASGSTRVIDIVRSGANANASHTAYGLYSSVTNTGTTSVNIAGYFSASGATTNYGLLVPSGNVGFGTSTPGTRVQIGDSTSAVDEVLTITSNASAGIKLIADVDNVTETHNPYVFFSQDGAAVTSVIGLVGNAGASPVQELGFTNTIDNAMLVGSYYAGALQLGTSAATRMTILADGKVGIGTTGPTEALDLVGNFKVSGTINGIKLSQPLTTSVGTMLTTNFRTTMFGSSALGPNLSISRWESTVPAMLNGLSAYGTINAWGAQDTHGFIALNYATAGAIIGGGGADSIYWTKSLAFSDHNHTVDSLSNVTMTNKQINDILKWNGTAWVNTPLTTNGATPIRQEFTATANQTVFTLTNGSYVTGSSMLSVFIWGQKQPPSAYTETSATSFTLAAGVPAGTKVLAEWFSNITLGAEGRAGQILKYTLTNISTDNQGRLWKSGGTDNSWDSQAYSAEAYTGGCFLSWKVNTTAVPIMFGLNTDPTTDASFSSLDYAWYMHNGNRKIYESNVNTYTSGTYAVGDVFAISYDGANVKYYHNGELCKTTAAAAGLKLYVDSSFYVKTVDYQLYDIFFAPAGAIGPQGPQGPQGIQGIQGIQGPQGPAGTLSATTNWTMAQNADGSLGFTYV